jgi:mannosyltransferase
MPGTSAPTRLLLLIICILAAVLRIVGLDTQSLWHDELFSWFASQMESLSEAIEFGAAQDVHPPGFVVFLFYWQRVFGDSEVALRLPSAIAGVAACGWMFLLGRRWLNTRVGINATLLLTTSWTAIYFSQEARAYSLLLLGSIVLTERILSIHQKAASEATPLRTIGLITFLCIAMSYLHYFGLLFVALTLGFWSLSILRKRSDWTTWLIVSGITLVAYLPWVARVLKQIDRAEVWIPDVSFSRVIEVYDNFANEHLLILCLLWIAGGTSSAIWATVREKQTTKEWFLSRLHSPMPWLLGWVTVPMIFAVIISESILPVLTDRNLIIMLPGMLLITAVALHSLERWFGGKPIPTVLFVALMLADLLGPRQYYQTPTKWQYRSVAQSVIEQAKHPNDIAFVSGSWHPSYFDYYLEQEDSAIRVTHSAKGLKQLRKGAKQAAKPTVFVAAPVGKRRKSRGQLQVPGYTRTKVEHFIGWDLYRFSKTPPSK